MRSQRNGVRTNCGIGSSEKKTTGTPKRLFLSLDWVNGEPSEGEIEFFGSVYFRHI
jgi:hypothetical protein